MRIFFIIIICLFCDICQAQQKWEVGGFAGASFYSGDLIDSTTSVLSTTGFSAGALLRRIITPRVNLRGYATFAAIKANEDKNGRKLDPSPFFEATVLGEFDPWGNYRRPDDDTFVPTFSLYFFGGVGSSFVSPRISFRDTTDNVLQDIADAEKFRAILSVPVGAGLRYDLSRNWVLQLEGSVRVPVSDRLDGVNLSGGANNDFNGHFGLLVSYKFGGIGADTDGDGFPDNDDTCPKVPGKIKGCPDEDKDKVIGAKDECPDAYGLDKNNGCPDTDEDGIIDKDDNCPNEPGRKAAGGCPDADKDDVADNDDDCPKIKGPIDLKGCPDSDGDGVRDIDDKCPTKYGSKELNGCPEQ